MKKFLSLCLAAVMLLSLAACGSKKPDSDAGAATGVDQSRGEGATVSDGGSDDSFGGTDLDPSFEVDANEEDRGPRPLTKDTSAGEVYIAEEFFDQTDMKSDVIRARIGDEIADYIGDSGVADLCLIINNYSIEGLRRELAYGYEQYEAARKAAVVACWMFGIEYEALWKDGFMPKDEAQAAIEVVTAQSVG